MKNLNEQERKKVINKLKKVNSLLKENINISQEPSGKQQQLNDDANVPQENKFKREIGQVRQISMNAVSKLANEPKNPNYDFFMKIWAMCDKQLTSN